MAATPASAEPMAKVTVMVRLTLMPISSAASLSSDTARMALPIRVRLINRDNPTMIMAVTAMVAMVMPSMYTPPSSTLGMVNSTGKAFCSEP